MTTGTQAVSITFIAACVMTLSGCAAVQVRQNTLDMVDNVARIRRTQVLQNVATAIDDHDMVPSEIFLGTGQATVTSGVSPALKLPKFDFAPPTRELDISVTDMWSAQWQFASVTNADDLRRLRNLYVLIASSDEEYDALEDYFDRNKDQRDGPDCAGVEEDGSTPNPQGGSPAALKSSIGPGGEALAPSKVRLRETAAERLLSEAPECPAGDGPGQIPKWRQALDILENGDSIDCRLYQENLPPGAAHAPPDTSTRGLPFRRWLFWRKPGADWSPETPDATPRSLGRFSGYELGTTSQGCLDDFIILVQAATPTAAAASVAGARVMQPPP